MLAYCHNLRNIYKIAKNTQSRLAFRLCGSPQLKGLVTRLMIVTPKKPNSAIRHVAKLNIYKTKRRLLARIPGIGSLPTKFNRVLARGGRANDLPSVRFTLIRNVYDFAGLYGKKKRRSIYGTKRPENYTKHIRRCHRHLFQ
jgi:small subunit ribosomal protein S12